MPMHRSHVALIVALLIMVVGGMFIFANLKRTPSTMPQADGDVVAQETGMPEITRITAKHFFTDPPGVHTLAGELPVASPCDLLTTNVVLVDGGSKALISFDIINNSGDQCEQKVTPQRFKVGFQAPRDIQMEAVYRGNKVELNLVPAAEGETPADFQMQIKG